jgi:parallel beta-helix repeat protein
VGAQTGTQFNGIIDTDTTWTKTNSPYILTGPVAVAQGVTLTIESGVSVNIGTYSFIVNGTLKAIGDSQDQLSLSSRYPGGLYFMSSSTSWNEQTGSGCIIENARIDGDIILRNASIKINACTLSSGNLDCTGSSTIANNSLSFMEVVINSGAVFSGNRVSLVGADSRAIAIKATGPVTIINNIIVGSTRCGIQAQGAVNSKISDNHVKGFYEGISANHASIERNQVLNNTVGIYAREESVVIDNTISGNTIGLKVSSATVIQHNNIVDCKQNSIYLDTSQNVNVTNNWWGTTDTAAIAASIHDLKNDYHLGSANFVPFLTNPNLQAPALPTPNSTPTHSPEPTATLQSSTPFPITTQTPTQTPSALPSASPTAYPVQNVDQTPLYAVIAGLGVAVAMLSVAVVVLLRKTEKTKITKSVS